MNMIGDVLLQRYRIDTLIRSDVHHELWSGWDLETKSPISLKIASAYADRTPILFEGEVLASIGHPRVVRLLDFGLHHGRPCLIMEAMNGQSLAHWLEAASDCPWEVIVELMAQALDGLGALHAKGLCHSNITPHCMIVRDRAQPSITLVGVERARFIHAGEGPMSTSGEGRWTHAYKAPEQLGGGPVGPVTDIYAIGVILWEAIGDRLPLIGESTKELGAHPWRMLERWSARTAAPLISSAAILRAMLHPSREHRISDARSCARQLRAIINKTRYRESVVAQRSPGEAAVTRLPTIGRGREPGPMPSEVATG